MSSATSHAPNTSPDARPSTPSSQHSPHSPPPDLDQARAVLEDLAVFWQRESDPNAKRQFLNLILDGVWLDDHRVAAVQPKPSFLPFFENRQQNAMTGAGVNDGSDGTRTRDLRRDRPGRVC
jgi:hypothetical protein